MSAALGLLCLGLGAAMVFSLYRVIAGPTPFDRLTGLGLVGTKSALLLAALGAYTGQADFFADLVLAYALIAFIGTLALARYFERGGTVDP